MAGTMIKRGKNKWRLMVSAGYDENGKRIRHTKTITAKNEQEASKELARFVTEMEDNPVKGRKLKIASFIDLWLEYQKSAWTPKTHSVYSDYLKRYVTPTLGHKYLQDVKPPHLLQLYSMLQEEGISKRGNGKLSLKTIEFIHVMIYSMFKSAVQWQYIAANPAGRVHPPKAKSKESKFYSTHEVQQLLSCLKKDNNLKYIFLVQLTLATGMRRGELVALEWDDFNMEEGIVDINKSTAAISGVGNVTGKPKTKSSIRKVSVPETIIQLAKKYKASKLKDKLACKDKWLNSPCVFTNDFGGQMSANSISVWWINFIRRHNLPAMPFHGLRHTSASLLIAKGVHAKVISSRLGHSSISITMDTYGHMMEETDKDSAKCLNDIFTVV
ncbi:MAG: tyrosine recombinase XerC [bacterium]